MVDGGEEPLASAVDFCLSFLSGAASTGVDGVNGNWPFLLGEATAWSVFCGLSGRGL